MLNKRVKLIKMNLSFSYEKAKELKTYEETLKDFIRKKD